MKKINEIINLKPRDSDHARDFLKTAGKHWSIIEQLFKQEMYAGELATKLQKKPPQITKAIKELKNQDLIEVHERNRRKYSSLTTRGKEIYSATQKIIQLSVKPRYVLPINEETNIWLNLIKSYKKDEHNVPQELYEVMCQRLTKVETTSQELDDIVVNLLDQLDPIELTSYHEALLSLLTALVKFNQSAMEKVKEKTEQLKTSAKDWLRRAKENPNDKNVRVLEKTHLEVLKLLYVVLDKEARESFFMELFEESLSCDISIDGVSAYARYMSFIDDKLTLFKNLVKMATEESDERLNNIINIIKRYEYFSG